MAASWKVLVLVLRYRSAWSRNRGKSFPCNANSRYMKGMKLCNRTTRSSNPIFGLNSENVFASFLLFKLLGRIGITYAFCCVFGWFDILFKELLCSTRNDKNIVTFTNVPVSLWKLIIGGTLNFSCSSFSLKLTSFILIIFRLTPITLISCNCKLYWW